MVPTGRWLVVFDDLDEPGPSLAMDATDFDKQFPVDKPKPKPVFVLSRSWTNDDQITWQCRSCRQLQDPRDQRNEVLDDKGQELGHWCDDCVVSRCQPS